MEVGGRVVRRFHVSYVTGASRVDVSLNPSTIEI